MDFKKVISPISWNTLPPEFLSSLLAMAIVIIISIIVRIKLNNYDPLKKPHGFLHIIEILIEFTDKQVKNLMGDQFEGFGGYILALGLYIILGFIIGMIGIPNFAQPNTSYYLQAMPNPFTNTAMPLSIAIVTFVLTHYTAIKYKKWSYFKRYIEPIPLFLPINLVTMWSSMLSLTLRLFGNALAGYCVITLIYVGFSYMFPIQGVGLVLTPLLAPVAHLYFDLFDGAIQLMVFCMLTMINISSEYVSPSQLQEEKEEKRLKKEQRRLRHTKKIKE